MQETQKYPGKPLLEWRGKTQPHQQKIFIDNKMIKYTMTSLDCDIYNTRETSLYNGISLEIPNNITLYYKYNSSYFHALMYDEWHMSLCLI